MYGIMYKYVSVFCCIFDIMLQGISKMQAPTLLNYQ